MKKKNGSGKSGEKRFCKGDALCICAVVFAAAALLFLFSFSGSNRGNRAEIIDSSGETIAVLPLDRNSEYSVSSNGYTLAVTVSGGEAFVSSADCPDRFCVGTGRISKSSQSIICVPAGIMVRISGDAPGPDGPDAVAG